MERRPCVLYEDRRECIECGDCNICDLDPSKICDNCGKCIGLNGDLEYLAVKVDGIITEDMNPDDYLYDSQDIGVVSGEDDDELVWP